MSKQFTSIQSYNQQARIDLPNNVFSFIDSGSHDELAIARNKQSFQNCLLMPRVLRGVSEVSTHIDCFGYNMAAPVLIAPSAYQGLLSKNGELDMLAAANRFNAIVIQSMFSSFDYRLIAKSKEVPVWLQMYLLKDRAINTNYIQMANDLNFDALVLTLDAPVYAKKEREKSNPLTFPPHFSWSHLRDIGIPIDECLNSKRHLSSLLDPSISWADLDWIASQTHLPLILKGIIDPRDTEIALNYPNVKGIIISNHGGRQLDSCPAPLAVMKAHKEIAGSRVKLFLDGGISRGSDVFKAIALGADATLIGRSALWPLAVDADQGVFQALSILQQELEETMFLCGCSTIDDINAEFIAYEEKQ